MKQKMPALILCLLFAFSAASRPAGALETPAQPPRDTVALGANHYMAVRPDGGLWIWGANNFGQLGDGSINHRPAPFLLMDGVRSAYAFHHSSFAVTEAGELYAWGNNTHGTLGTDSREHQLKPRRIMTGVAGVVASSTYTYAILTDGSLMCWGADHGNLSIGSTSPLRPSKVMDDVSGVVTNGSQTLALRTDGTLWSWGVGYEGLLGAESNGMFPVKILSDVKSMALGAHLAAAVLRDGTLMTWGLKTRTKDSFTADLTPVKAMTGVEAVSAQSMCLNILKSDATVWTVLVKSETKSGYETLTRAEPVKLMEKVKKLFSSPTHSAAIAEDGSLWTWGENSFGQLGDGTLTARAVPVRAIDGGVTFALPGKANTAALKADGSLWVWGLNGQDVDEAGLGGSVTYALKMLTDIALPAKAVPAETVDLKLGEASAWAAEHIESAAGLGLLPDSLIGGYKNDITRAEFCLQAVTLLEAVTGKTLDTILADKELDVSENPFVDTDESLLIAAYRLGIVSGKSGGRFDPAGKITREEAAVMLTNTVTKALGYIVTAPASTFPDRDSVSSWAVDAVDYISAKGVMSGTSKGFEPKAAFSREQADVTFVKLYQVLQ